MPLCKMRFHAVGFVGLFDGGWTVEEKRVIARFRGSMIVMHELFNRVPFFC